MPRSISTLTLQDAKRMLDAAETIAGGFGVAYSIAVVDSGGHLLGFVRQDEALIGSIDLAIDKAVTARIYGRPTAVLAELGAPGQPLYGIAQANGGRAVIFGGGVPIIERGQVLGAVGASAGTIEQDIAVAEAAAAALQVATADATTTPDAGA